MSMIKRILLFLVFTYILNGQGNPDYKPVLFNIGISGGCSYNWQASEYSQLPGIPNGCTAGDTDCLKFRGGSGYGYAAGFSFVYPLNKSFEISASLNYLSISGSESFPEFIGYTGEAIAVNVEHIMETKYEILNFTPGIMIKPFDYIPLKLSIGIDILLIAGTNFLQYEKLSQDAVNAGVTFAGLEQQGKTLWNSQSGEIPESVNNGMGLNAAVAYNFKINQRITFTPEVKLSLALNSLNKVIDWTYLNINAGMSVSYSFLGKSQNEIFEDQRIKDSIDRYNQDKIRIRDSIASYLAEQERINDSILVYKARQEQIADSLSAAFEMENQAIGSNNTKITYQCCSILYYSGYDDGQTEKTLNLIREGIEELNKSEQYFIKRPLTAPKIEKIVEKDGKTRFRIISDCFASASEAEYILIESGLRIFLEDMVRGNKLSIYPSYKCN